MTLLSGADIQFKRAHRLDVALVKNLPIALVFLPAADIPHFVANGRVDLGVTGHDMVQEAGPSVSSQITEELALGFGKCQLQVQVPEEHTTIKSIEDLVGKKVATSFDVLAGEFFRELDAKVNAARNLSGADVLKTEIEYLNGSVETACALGLSQGIVDLVESGETMRACGLKPIATLLSSEAFLIRPTKLHSDKHSALVRVITSRIRGVIAAGKYVLCQYNIHRSTLPDALKITPGRRAATVTQLEEDGWSAVSSMVTRDEVANIMDRLEKVGATDILILGIDNCRV